MIVPILTTKFYIPPPRPKAVQRKRLLQRLTEGVHRKLTLIAAPAGFGKTTLISEWVANCGYPVAWVSLDDKDSDPIRFLSYVIAALQTINSSIGADLETSLQSPQPPPINVMLTTVLNDIATISDKFLLVLDDYHALDNQAIDDAVGFLIDYLPPHMHLVLVTREDPQLPLSRLRARGQLMEFRAADLRFNADEAVEFLNTAMGLDLSLEHINALETRTEGWIAGLQLAALSVQGKSDVHEFITAFTGDNRYIVDYLVDEVLSHQPEAVREFLLQTSVLDRLSGDLCDAVTQQCDSAVLLENLERNNLFVIPLDDKRIWFRYHHLFVDVLRAHLKIENPDIIPTLHQQASGWYEKNGFEIEAFQHAAAGNDIDRAESIIVGSRIPIYFRGAVRPVLNWLTSLSPSIMNDRPSLWVMYGWTLMIAHQNAEVESKLQSAAIVLAGNVQDENSRDLVGSIAALRAMLAANIYDTDKIIQQSHQALEYLHTDNMYIRAVVLRSLAIAYQFRGERDLARKTYQEAIIMSEASNNLFVNILCTTGLGMIQLSDNELYNAEASYQHVLNLVGDSNQPITCAAFFGLAQINYQWDKLDKAREYGEHSVHLSKQIDVIDSSVSGEIFLGKLQLAQGNIDEASSIFSRAEQQIYQNNFVKQIPAIISARVRLQLHLGNITEAERLLETHDLPLSKARVCLAQDDAPAALSILASYRQHIEAQNLQDERLNIMVLQSLAYHQNGDLSQAIETITAVLQITAPEGFIRLFLDEGLPMLKLLNDTRPYGIVPAYVDTLIAAFESETIDDQNLGSQPLIEPLSDRELEVLQLVADGLSNREIGARLYLALSTVKGHNRNIYGKLGVKRRTEAVARARELGLISTN